MEVTFAPRDILQIDDARITYRNFEGKGTKYNREGDRNFAWIIPDEELAGRLSDLGWNVKVKPPREEGDDPFMYLPIKIKFNNNGPHVYLTTPVNHTRLDEDMIGMLDDIEIESVSLDIRPYDWEVQGKTGRTAYLQSMEVRQRMDRFAARYAAEEHPEE